MLTREQKQKLQAAAKKGEGALATVVEILKAENPEAFHTEATLSERVFIHQPDPKHRIPHSRFIKPFPVIEKVW